MSITSTAATGTFDDMTVYLTVTVDPPIRPTTTITAAIATIDDSSTYTVVCITIVFSDVVTITRYKIILSLQDNFVVTK